MAPRKRCPGLVACSEGHILQNYRNEANEVEEVGPHLLKKRNLKSTRVHNKTRSGGHNTQLYHGNRGRYLYFECLQLLLRHQIAFLIDRWGLPAEFEIVCRDLPYFAQQDQDGAADDVPAGEDDAPTDEEDPKDEERDDDEANDPKVDAESSDEHDTELDDLLAENSASSSSSDEEGQDEDAGKANPLPQPKRPPRHKHNDARPVSTLVVLVLACWTLRVPLLNRDLTRLVETYELPMTVHLTKHTMQALSPHNTPSVPFLHRLASSLARRIYASFGVRTPEANAAPILWRVVNQGLGGSPTLYRLTKRLAAVLSLPLTLHRSLAPRLERRRGYDPETHKNDSVAPEVAFVATAIIVLKMVYGLDGELRLPEDAGDAACEMPRVDEYLERLGKLADDDAQFDSKTAMSIEDLSGDTVDEYLAFCERALLGQPAKVLEEEVLQRYFPLKMGQAEVDVRIAGPLWDLGATGLKRNGEAVLRPGEEYTTVWDSASEVPDEYSMVARRGGKFCGVSSEYVWRVVRSYERRLWRGRGRLADQEVE
ncbi:hypothetical protein B0H11DRAFT_1969266 [Mycena galericulata]|nr:hypothetical protein B0H11DRAFT_1969266 [Mycena galericulata]